MTALKEYDMLLECCSRLDLLCCAAKARDKTKACEHIFSLGVYDGDGLESEDKKPKQKN